MNARHFFMLSLAAALISGCDKPPAPPAPRSSAATNVFEPRKAQPRLPTIQLWIGPEQMDAEVAATVPQIITGMMFRTNMGPNDGMIFILPETRQASFWMKNCYVPLSVAYITPEGVIQEIHDLQPQNTNAVMSRSEDIRFALETPQGWFKLHHIPEGTVVRTERGPLMSTFGQKP